MPHDDSPIEYRAGALGSTLLALLLVASLGFVSLACTPSTADSKKDEEQAAEAEAESNESETYDIPAYTGNRTVEQRINDASLAAQVTQALVRQRELRVFDFEPDVDGDTVTLQGDVNTRSQWMRAGRVAEQAAQGRTVVNEVTIGGRSADEVEEDDTAERASSQGTSTSAVYHTVQRGESLWEIARQYGASVQRIQGLNDLATDNLRVGQRVRVR